MTLVVDASVTLKWFFLERDDEPDRVAATEILERFVRGEIRLLAPGHFQAEVCAVLAREAPDAMNRQLSRLLDLAVPARDDALVLARAMRLAHAQCFIAACVNFPLTCEPSVSVAAAPGE